jgi:hypothetical protein
MVMSPSRIWPISYVHCKIQTRPLVREGALHEEGSTCQTKEHVKSAHGPQRAARHQDVPADWPSVANSTPLHSTNRTVRKSSRSKQNDKEFNWTVRSSSGIEGKSKAGQVQAQRRQFELMFRSLGSLALWLDREEELVPEELKTRQC